MPKVETLTLLLLKRGDIDRLSAPQNTNCVSKCFGNNGENGYNFNKSRFGLENYKQIKFRFKRDLEEPNLDVEHSLPKRRVVKKLIRIQPIYNQTLELNNRNMHEVNYIQPRQGIPSSENSLSSSEENYSSSTSASRKHYRKRVVIKKRRKKRPKIVVPSTTHHRRKVVVTRKRLLTNTTSITAQPESVTASIISEISTSPIVEVQETLTAEEIDETESSTLPSAEETSTSNITTTTFPYYEPFFPELSESLDAPIILLKTTVVSSIEYQTETVVQSKLKTYTFVVTRVSGSEQIVTSTTEVKSQTKTLTVTEPRTVVTTLTLLDLEATETLPFLPLTVDSSPLGTTPHYTDTQEYDGRTYEEARYNNLATRVMSNGVEVIVAGDKSTLPGEPDVKRILPSSIYKPITLKPSTLSDHMMMLLPQDASNAESLSSSLHPNQFVTKTCLTTFTYLTTYLENGSTSISSHEQVVSNIATEERNSVKVIPTPSTGITLTQHPNLAVGIFMTTYTYLNTILDGEQPLVVTSKHTVTNTVTAPDDYLSLLQPPKKASAVKDTNTYYSTISLEKTLYEGKASKVISTNEVLTQVVITESIPPKATSVMTSYIALDFEDNGYSSMSEYTTTDVVKTYFVTYTYFNTLLENGHTIVKTNVSTSSDVVTEKLFLYPKRTHSASVINTSPITKEKKKNKIDAIAQNLEIHATKTYVTTFTYLTTLLQENNKDVTSTVISSHTREVDNVVTETIDQNLLDKQYLNLLQNELKGDVSTVVKLATFHDGQKLEITAVKKEKISPTKVLPIEKTQMVENKINLPQIESSNPNVVTGSTIIFFDEVDQIDSSSKKPTPSLTYKPVKTTKTANNGLGSLLSSEIVKKSQIISTQKVTSKTHSTQTKRHTNKRRTRIPVVGTKSQTAGYYQATATLSHQNSKNKTNIPSVDPPPKKKIANNIGKPEIPDLLGLGSINMNTLHALKPVINAMAGLIKTNLNGNVRNNTLITKTTPKFDVAVSDNNQATSNVNINVVPAIDIQNRSPVYIPLGEQEEGLEIAESQNVATIHINEWEEEKLRPHKDQVVIGKPTHESPLLNGGIPISPGQVITANSDVIVGKPGRIGPRIPSIPLNHEEIPIDMKPPPVSHGTWPKRHNDKFGEPLASASLKKEKPELEGQRDDYLGPPPPLAPPKLPLRPPNFVRGEKHKTVVDRKRPNYEQPSRIPINFQNIQYPILQDNRQSPQVILPHIVPLQIPLEAPTVILANPINDINIQPSILNEPIVLPEVIERSTGQPLLVNLQPSQVAFVNIPHNRTTALIYGGSTEPHRNGQYFDDPSPYPEPEFSGIEHFSNGIPQYASVYDDTQPPNQKQVGGVIKVGTNVINNQPPSVISSNRSQIRPSRPTTRVPSHQNVNINAPPISFGMVHLGNDFNAHIINHGDIQFSPPPASFNVVSNKENQNVIPQGGIIYQQPNHIPIVHQEETFNRYQDFDGRVPDNSDRPVIQEDLRPPSNEIVRPIKRPNTFEQHLQSHTVKHRLRPKPNLNNVLMEYLTPPQFNKFSHSRPEIPIRLEPEISVLPSSHQHHPGPHIPINPINLEHEISVAVPPLQKRPEIPINFKPEIDLSFPSSVPPNFSKKKPLPIPLTPQHGESNKVIRVSPIKPQHLELDEEVDSHRDDDIVNEAGEVTQESNPRPLRPGQIPIEVLRSNLTTIQKLSNFFKNSSSIRYPETHNVNFGIQVAGHANEIPNYRRPVIQEPRPFEIRPIVRPENQQTNQVNHHEQTFLVHSGHEQGHPFVRPEKYPTSNQIYDTQNIYGYTSTKQPQYFYEGTENINITFGQKVPNPTDPFYPTNVVSNNAFVKPNRYNVMYTTLKPLIKTTISTAPSENFYDHTIGSVEIVPIDTQKRPHITSMPVNFPVFTRRPLVNIYEYAQNFGSQTEKPFNASLSNLQLQPTAPTNTTFSFNNDDVIQTQNIQISTESDVVTQKTSAGTEYSVFASPTNLLENLTRYESDMEIMKPPPPPEPATSMQPPKIEVHSPSGGIQRVPNLNHKRPVYDLEGQASSPSPYVPQVMDNILPPKTQEVMGLSPPPPITTHRPILLFIPNVTTHKTIFSLEIDATKIPEKRPIHPYTFETPTTTPATTRRRKPHTRRPLIRRKTTTSVVTLGESSNWPTTEMSTTKKITTKEPPREEVSETKKEETSVAPSPSISVQNKPSLEVIIGNPESELDVKVTTAKPEESNVEMEIIGSEVPWVNENVQTTSTEILENIPTSTLEKIIPKTIVTKVASTVNTYISTDYITPTLTQNFVTGVHHAGNEVKVVDDSTLIPTSSSNSKKSTPTTGVSKESKVIIPTRYITHTKTSTITIIKTTVVKTLGGPPSTMTILFTKTEKSTIVDTVTEIHTVVKPTNIIETITTTVNQIPNTLYPPDVPYGHTYSAFPPILATPTLEPSTSTVTTITEAEDDLEEFIIHDTDPPPLSNPNTTLHIPTDNDSIFVVMTDQKHGEVITIPQENEDEPYETQSIDEVASSNEVNRVLLGGILIASPPSLETPDSGAPGRHDKCNPECKATKNELCQKVEGIMRCVCRPGFARMFPDRPCKPTYTYSIKLGLERRGKEKLRFEEALADSNSPEFTRLATVTHEALDRMVMQSDLRDIYHGVHVHSYEPVLNDEGVINNFYLQLSDNTDEQRLKDIFKKYLRSNNYSLGGTDLYASKDFLDNLAAEDFDECANSQFHDCSEYAHCFNLPGTYTCSCKEGYSDLSENSLYPGRICSAELIGCEKCHYHGTCYSRGDDQIICECFQWYAGENCHINLKVLLIALVTLGMLLFVLLLVCIILTCARRKPHNAGLANGMSFMPQRLSNHNARRSTMDRRAMIQDTSSEGSQSDTNTLPYVAKAPKKQLKGALKKTTAIHLDVENGSNSLSYSDQKDRSLPVMIPRAKYHPAPPTSPLLNMDPFDKRKPSASSNETKLLSYLDAGPSPSKVEPKQKYSKAPNDSLRKHESRKLTGGALVSAGFEVSATVGVMGTIGTTGTTCGTEADRSENATLIQKISADLLSSTGTRSQFTTFRKSLVDDDINDPLSNWLDIPPKITATVSEARSYDETTIQPPTKSYRNGYDSKPSSQHQNDEANTMAERDVGSTFLLPHTHLYKPDRGSDISGFDSL